MRSNFTRWSGVAGLLAGLMITAGRFLAEPFTGQYLLSGLLAIGMWKTGILPRWLPALWVLVPLIGLPGVILALAGSSVSLTTPATIALGLALTGTGYGLWTAPASLATPAATST